MVQKDMMRKRILHSPLDSFKGEKPSIVRDFKSKTLASGEAYFIHTTSVENIT